MAANGGALSRVTIRHVLVLAFALRLLWALFVPAHPISDSSVYDELAQRMAQGGGYSWADGTPTAYWPVGTSALYGLIYTIFGYDLLIAALVNVLLGTALVAAIYALASARFDPRTGLLAALISAVWPTWIAMTSVISSDLPSNLLIVTALICALSATWPAWARVAGCSVLLVGATYFRANMIPLIVLVPALVALQKRKPGQMVAHAATALLIGVVLIGPWTYRNYQVFGAVVPISTNFGANLWMANNPEAYGGYMPTPALPGLDRLPENEAERDKIYSRYAKDFIVHNPASYLKLCLNRIFIVTERETFGVAWNLHGLPKTVQHPIKVVMTGYWFAVLALSLAGLFLFLRRDPFELLSPLVVVPAVVLAPAVLVLSSERYHYGAAPFMAIFAACALIEWSKRRFASRAFAQSELST